MWSARRGMPLLKQIMPFPPLHRLHKAKYFHKSCTSSYQRTSQSRRPKQELDAKIKAYLAIRGEPYDIPSALVRPDLRIHVGSNRSTVFNRPLKHDDVVIVPELFGAEDDESLYYKLVEEMRDINSKGDKNAELISVNLDAHLISKDPSESKTFNMVIDRMCEYFHIEKHGIRLNWYRDSSDWKPFHQDSAAYNEQRARNQNITVGASFGSMRELVRLRFVFAHVTHPN